MVNGNGLFAAEISIIPYCYEQLHSLCDWNTMACVIRVENTGPEMNIRFQNDPKSDPVLKSIT